MILDVDSLLATTTHIERTLNNPLKYLKMCVVDKSTVITLLLFVLFLHCKSLFVGTLILRAIKYWPISTCNVATFAHV